MEQFSKESSKLSYLSKDFEILDKQTKPKLVESLMIALTALHLADSCMKKNSATILKSMDELMEQTELASTLTENKKKNDCLI